MANSVPSASATGSGPFHLSIATPADLPEMMALFYRCFGPMVRRVLMGFNSEDDISRVVEMWKERQRTEAHSMFIKVVDKATGKIIAATCYNVHPNCAPVGGGEMDRPVKFLEGETREQAQKLLDEWVGIKRREHPGGYIHLHICGTEEAYRRRGAASMMLEWGNRVADALGVSCWVEASERGKHLYKKYGYNEFLKLEGDVGVLLMRREARLDGFDGGKPAATEPSAEAAS